MNRNTIVRLLETRAKNTPAQVAFRVRNADRSWCPIDWQEFKRRVDALAGQLIELNFRPGDRAVISMPTSIHWECCHHAILAAGGIVVGADAHDTDHNLSHLLATVRPIALFVESTEQLERFGKLMPSPPQIRVALNKPDSPGIHALDDLLSASKGPLLSLKDRRLLPKVSPDQNATIVFTSGSTGTPKGIAFTHEQLCVVARALVERFAEIEGGARLACWLPLSNLFQRVINLCATVRGAESYFVENPTRIIELLPEIQPALFLAVPRFYEKLHAGILQQLERQPWLIRRFVMAAWEHGRRFQGAKRRGESVGWIPRTTHRLADSIALRRIRTLMGADLRFMVSGSAPIPVWLLESLHGLGWLVLEAYGTSENALPIALNTSNCFRFGSVGRVLEPSEVKVAEDGELLVRGPTVFLGYYGESSESSPLDADGFLHTGDVGRIDDDGFLWLTGRKSEIFKTSTGRRIPPVPIEACLTKVTGIDYAMVIGKGQPFLIAVLSLDLATLGACCTDGSCDEALVEELRSPLAASCMELASHLRPAGVLLTRRPFSIEGGELTTTRKLRRNAIEQAYREQVALFVREIEQAPPRQNRPLCKVIGGP